MGKYLVLIYLVYRRRGHLEVRFLLVMEGGRVQ